MLYRQTNKCNVFHNGKEINKYQIQEFIPVGCVLSAAVTVVGVCVFAGGCTCLEWVVYLPGVWGGSVRGVPTWGWGVYLPKRVCVPARGVNLSGGGCVPAGKAPAWRVYLPGDVYLPGGIVPAQGVYMPGGTCPWGVPAHWGVSQHALRQTLPPPVDRMTDGRL